MPKSHPLLSAFLLLNATFFLLVLICSTCSASRVPNWSWWGQANHDASHSAQFPVPTDPLVVRQALPLSGTPSVIEQFQVPSVNSWGSQVIVGPDLALYFNLNEQGVASWFRFGSFYEQQWLVGLSAHGSPALSPDGTQLYVLTGAPGNHYASNLVALSATDGHQLWNVSLGTDPICTGANLVADHTSPVVLPSGLVIVATRCNDLAQLWGAALAFQPTTGSRSWSYVMQVPCAAVQAALVPSQTNDSVVAVLFAARELMNATVVGISSTQGTVSWRLDLADSSVTEINGFVPSANAIILGANDNAYIVPISSGANITTLNSIHVDAVNPTSSEIFGFSVDGSVYKLDAQGKTTWKTTLPIPGTTFLNARLSLDGNSMLYVAFNLQPKQPTNTAYTGAAGVRVSDGRVLWYIANTTEATTEPGKVTVLGDGSVALPNADQYLQRLGCGTKGCTCLADYYPANNCSVFCNREITCSGKGNCDSNGQCVCDAGKVWEFSHPKGDDCGTKEINGPLVGFVVVIVVAAFLLVISFVLGIVAVSFCCRSRHHGYSAINH